MTEDLTTLFPGASADFLRANGVEPPAKVRVKYDSFERALKFVSEREFQAQVIELARQWGWHVVHFHDSRRQSGGAMVGDSDAAGWPDLTLIRERALFRELKKVGGKVTPDQERMLERLRHAGCDAEIWRPTDWDLIHKTLGQAGAAGVLAATASPSAAAEVRKV